MGPPRRTPASNSNVSQPSSPRQQRSQHKPNRSQSSLASVQQQPSILPNATTASTSSTLDQPNLGMTPQSRYQYNLKVLRRRDPSIVSIFDQFSHVCVYHHDGQKWEKQGFEGSMFLFERESYPPYGFYILNRVGMSDYVQSLYPEDDLGAHGSYLMLRSFPDFTERRLANAAAVLPSNSGASHDRFSDIYKLPELSSLTEKDKGKSRTVGLWMFATDVREPMIDVMTRLHSYVKKNEPYPEEFRYGPDKPPPPNPHARPASTSNLTSQNNNVESSPTNNDSSSTQSRPHSHAPPRPTTAPISQSNDGAGPSELDRLFARLAPTPASYHSTHPITSTSSSPSFGHAQATSTTPKEKALSSKMSVQSLFAAFVGSGSTASPVYSERGVYHHELQSQSRPQLSSREDVANDITPKQQEYWNPRDDMSVSEYLQSFSDPRYVGGRGTSTSSVADTSSVLNSDVGRLGKAEQVLTQDVISSLLGLPPSRAPSVAGLTTSEESGEEGSGDLSDSPGKKRLREAQYAQQQQKWQLEQRARSRGYSISSDMSASIGDTSFGVDVVGKSGVRGGREEEDEELNASRRLAAFEFGGSSGTMGRGKDKGKGRVNGDVTPRPPFVPLSAPSVDNRDYQQQTKRNGRQPLSMEESFSQSTVIGDVSNGGPAVVSSGSGNKSNGGADVKKLNSGSMGRTLVPFQTDSELWPYPSDAMHTRGSSVSSYAAGSSDGGDGGDIVELDFEDTSALSDMERFKRVQEEKARIAGNGQSQMNGKPKGKGGKKGKKERAADREREREEIENSWDAPGFVASAPGPLPISTTTVSPVRVNAEGLPPTTIPASVPASVNGEVKGKTAKVNGDRSPVKKQGQQGDALDAGLVRDALVNGFLKSPKRPEAVMQKNHFLREVLTLIHTDQDFAESLWKDYIAKSVV